MLGCKGDAELSMERGIMFYEWDKIEKAILEFKYVIHKLSEKKTSLDYNEIKLLSKAMKISHYELAKFITANSPSSFDSKILLTESISLFMINNSTRFHITFSLIVDKCLLNLLLITNLLDLLS